MKQVLQPRFILLSKASAGFSFLMSLLCLFSQPALAQYQWSCHYPNFGYVPYDGRAWEGNHNVKYVSYIPVDHIQGPTTCAYPGAGSIVKIYKGDPGAIIYGYPPQSWRTSSYYSFTLSPFSEGPFYKDPGQTRNYGYGSPINGSTLSSADEDGVARDCYLFNDSGYANNSNWIVDLTRPYTTQGQVHYSGNGNIPTETVSGSIDWDMRTVIDTSNLDNITAKVNYNHTCYPAHAILLNNLLVYQYTPGRNDGSYLFNCLALKLDKVINEQSSCTRVPCN